MSSEKETAKRTGKEPFSQQSSQEKTWRTGANRGNGEGFSFFFAIGVTATWRVAKK
jgi:hypothetical protein